MIVRVKTSFFIGFILGSFVSCLLTLLFAQLASPLWVNGEDLRRTFELEQRAKENYQAGTIDKAIENIRLAAELRRMRPAPDAQYRWQLLYPLLPLELYVGGIRADEFAHSSQHDEILLLYGCIDAYLLMKKGEVTESRRIYQELSAEYPKASESHCLTLAKGYFRNDKGPPISRPLSSE